MKELIENLKGWWKISYARRSSEIETLKRREIKESIEKRCQMINGKQGKMLTSLLNRLSSKIKIDRLIEDTNGYRELIVEPLAVLDKTKKHFQNQLRLQNFRKENLNDEWEKIYKPKTSIQSDWYKDISQDITLDEWSEILAGLKKNTASEVTGIAYRLIQAAGLYTQEIFKTFAEICIKAGNVPKK
jgi:hypothetical protein